MGWLDDNMDEELVASHEKARNSGKTIKEFERYYDDNLKEWIESQRIADMVRNIRKMSLKELGREKDNIVEECMIDPSYESTYECRIRCKANIRAVGDCRRRGEKLIRYEPFSFSEAAEAVMHGWLVGDEISKRLWGH